MSPMVWLQYALPHRLLSHAMRALMHWRCRPWKNFLIAFMTRLYRIDVGEAASADAADYAHFNAYFTRALKPGARPAPPDPEALAMPADGRVSQLGPIAGGRIVQAKGHDYSVAELLADDAAAARYEGGAFITVYLSPRDYHRVHAPVAGRLLETTHVPGRLFSVAAYTVEAVPRLFARNERLACRFETAHGEVAVVLVGAMLVSGVQTVWGGVEIPPYASAPVRKDHRAQQPPIQLGRLDELGRFNMGSTVVVLLPPGVDLDPALRPGDPVRLGQVLARPNVKNA